MTFYICENYHVNRGRDYCTACGEQSLPEFDADGVRGKLETEVAVVAGALREVFPSMPYDDDGQVDYTAITDVARLASPYVGWPDFDVHAAVWLNKLMQATYVTIQGWLGDENGETLVETLPVEVWA